MDDLQFWAFIGQIDQERLDAGDDEGAVEPLVNKLSNHTASTIGTFEEKLCSKLYQLDGKAWYESMSKIASDDVFLYTRCYVVAKGRQYYEAVLGDPSLMPSSNKDWFEPLLYVSPEAWSIATGESEEDFDLQGSLSYETGSNDSQW